jgi:glucose-1-phosphate thymidylyltransferase
LKGVILAGGTGTRLFPLTSIINKHLLPVGKYPMIYYSVMKLREAGVEQILLVIGKQSAGLFIDYLGNGKHLGVQITYKIQDEPSGIAHALVLAEPLIKPEEKFIVILGDNLFEDALISFVQQFHEQKQVAKVLLKQIEDPRRYCVPILHQNNILFIEEKPVKPKSHFCITGIYMYDSDVFSVIKELKPSSRGELEITDVNNYYAMEGTLSYNILQGWWIDAGTHQSLHEASEHYL